MFAGMDGEHATFQKRAILLSDCFILILGIDILKYLFGGERLAAYGVALEPQSRSEVVFVVRNVDVVISKILLFLVQVVVTANFGESPLVAVLGDSYLLFSQFSDATGGCCWGDQVLFFWVGEKFAWLIDGLLPFPAEICELVSGLDELIGREHAFCLEVLVGGSYCRIEEAFYAVKHNNQFIRQQVIRILWYYFLIFSAGQIFFFQKYYYSRNYPLIDCFNYSKESTIVFKLSKTQSFYSQKMYYNRVHFFMQKLWLVDRGNLNCSYLIVLKQLSTLINISYQQSTMIKLLILGFFAYFITRIISRVFETIEGLFKSSSISAVKGQIAANNNQASERIHQDKIKEKAGVGQSDKRQQTCKDNQQQGIHPAETEEVSQSGSIVQLIGIISKNQAKKPEEATQQIHEIKKSERKPYKQLNQQPLAEVINTPSLQELNLYGRDKSNKEAVSQQYLRPKSDSQSSEAILKQTNSKYLCRFNEVQSPAMTSQQQQQIEMLREKLKTYSQSQVEIEQLRKQVEEYQADKKVYIDRIEDIIQHVMVSQQQNVGDEVKVDQDRELLAINNLKKQINHSYQLEKEREEQIAAELHQNLRRDKQELSQAYELRISQLQILVAERQRSNEQLQENVTSLTLQRSLVMEELSIKKQEIAKLSLGGTVGVQKTPLSKDQLYLKGQELILANQQLVSVRTQCQNIESELFQTSSKLFQMEAKIEELTKEKQEVQNKLNRQLQKQFIDQQRRQSEQSERQTALLNTHRIEIEEITKRLEVEQENSRSVLHKYENIKEELQFYQIQRGTASETQKQLRNQIQTLKAKSNQNQPSKFDLTDSEIQSHPVFLRMKHKYEQSEAKLRNLSPIRLAQNNEQSGLSVEPSPALLKLTDSIRSDRQPASLANNSSRESTSTKFITRVGSSVFGNTPNRREGNSAIFSGSYKEGLNRYKTPTEKPLQISLHESGNLSSTFFSQTSILDEKKRGFAIAQINRLKKIASKKTKLIYRWQGKNSRPITDVTSNVPNLFIVIELTNKKIIGAFSQTAFTKQGNVLSQKSKYLAMNKSMIMDISQEKVFPNQTTQQTIRYDENALIWGRNELVFSYGEPPMLACSLNCENAIYSCQYSTEQLIGDKQTSVTINHCEIFRIFLG